MALNPRILTQIEAKFGGVDRVEQAASANSQVTRLEMSDGRRFVVKAYPQIKDDPRDRLATEFGALAFLWQNGICDVPEPVWASEELQFGLYGYVPGEKITQAGAGDVDQSVEFVARLAGLREASGCKRLPEASDACFSCACFERQLNGRLERLLAMDTPTARHEKVIDLLGSSFLPFLKSAVSWVRERHIDNGLDMESEITAKARTLSPSDFGFHNAIRRPDAQLTFLDFEYFGWDDPAKLIVDFLLHPAMTLDAKLKQRFLDGVLAVFPDDASLPLRVELLYPLLGMKWCLIVLNEFLPGPMARRLAAVGSVSVETVLETQFNKAETRLAAVQSAFDRRPTVLNLATM
jgi:hypothetical protein